MEYECILTSQKLDLNLSKDRTEKVSMIFKSVCELASENAKVST